MPNSLALIRRALSLWWQEFVPLTLFNVAWFALQLPIVTGPPATAAMYVIARRLAEGEYLEFRHGWEALGQVSRPAWLWGLLNGLILLMVVGNFWLYQSATGWGWTLLRLAWAVIGLGWFAVNVFYWPFWLAQRRHSLRLALRNSFVFLALRPGTALSIVFIHAGLIVVSILLTLPLVAALMAWLALLGTLAVREELLSVEVALTLDPS